VTVSHLASRRGAVTDFLESRETAAVAAVRRAPKNTSGGCGKGTEPPNVERFIIRRGVRPQPANDNVPIQGGLEALYLAGGIVLTQAAILLALALL
jgi:hypothetical protein